jgi:hypothetical protein
MSDRCPSCAATVRAGDPWCTLCWADLRPKAASAVPPAPTHTPAPQAPAPPASPAGSTAVGLVDPLTAPLAQVLGEPLAADPDAPAPTWPCVECGEPNGLDRDACGVCTAPFGGRIARLPDAKAARRKAMVIAIGAVVAFLMLLAVVTLAATGRPPKNNAPVPITVQ